MGLYRHAWRHRNDQSQLKVNANAYAYFVKDLDMAKELQN